MYGGCIWWIWGPTKGCMWRGAHLDERWGLVEPEVWVSVRLVGLFGSDLVDRQGVSAERV